jgi:single-strand DNA-binding protein
MNYNKVVVVGRVTQSPDLRKTPSGQSVTSFGVATNRLWTDKTGEKHEDVEFHNVVLWGKLADLASAYVQKGSLVLVEGRLETRSWEDKEGTTRKSTQIVAEGIQFGPKPGEKLSPATKEGLAVEPDLSSEKTIHLDEEEGTGRHFQSAFGDEEDEIKPEDIPF